MSARSEQPSRLEDNDNPFDENKKEIIDKFRNELMAPGKPKKRSNSHSTSVNMTKVKKLALSKSRKDFMSKEQKS